MPRTTKLSLKDREVLHYYFGVSKLNKTDALRRAGYAHPNSYMAYFKRPGVVAEVARREAAVREKYDVSYDSMMEELMRIAKSSITDYITVDDDGLVQIDLTNATMEELKAIAEVTIETYTEGKGEDAREVKRVKVKSWNKLDAIDKVLRHAGVSKEKSPLEGLGALADRIVAARLQVQSTPVEVIETDYEGEKDA